jgi:hypothetical protein
MSSNAVGMNRASSCREPLARVACCYRQFSAAPDFVTESLKNGPSCAFAPRFSGGVRRFR